MATAGDIPNDDINYNLDFRSTKDDAWYTARVILDGSTLTVKFKDFPEGSNDEIFNAGDFSTSETVDEFHKRFRPVSLPFEDSECSKIIEGMTVCATYTEDGLVRFFDAVIEAVHYREHSSEKCLCTFMLFWQHGPAEGNITSMNIADICLILNSPIDARVAKFTNLAIEYIKMSSSQSRSIADEISLFKGSVCDTKNLHLPIKTEDMGSRQAYWSVPANEGWEGNTLFLQTDEDSDMGGITDTGSHRYIIIENLEKDLSPSLIVEFIHEQTSITPQAYVFPGLSSESSARGAIVLDTRMKLKRIHQFLNNPNHFVVSWTGRPWVIAENMPRNGTFITNFGGLLPNSQNSNVGCILKLVLSGTKEYERAKELKGLFMEFHNHLNGLRKTLDLLEKEFLHPSLTI